MAQTTIFQQQDTNKLTSMNINVSFDGTYILVRINCEREPTVYALINFFTGWVCYFFPRKFSKSPTKASGKAPVQQKLHRQDLQILAQKDLQVDYDFTIRIL
ncbi:hypothetical protein E2C01_024279 [Portunus trituberculatus]|uniref:Uncharacterized protein n=1 Tax=Portunus trituberculatus TaxID=210409 RepID=A0A5B7ECA2_PORTR|nr:hypothetical protein [Portunus trituberculatus]